LYHGTGRSDAVAALETARLCRTIWHLLPGVDQNAMLCSRCYKPWSPVRNDCDILR